MKKQLEYKKMKAELLESEFKVKAEINRRQSEIQATMDVLDAEMNLSVAEAELKIFEDEVENSKIFDRKNRTIHHRTAAVYCSSLPTSRITGSTDIKITN